MTAGLKPWLTRGAADRTAAWTRARLRPVVGGAGSARRAGHNAGMPDNTPEGPPRPVREVADSYVSALAELNPFVATTLGLRPDEDRMPDLSPAGQATVDDLRRSTLAALDALAPDSQAADDDERRCARLLRERLGAALAMSAAGEHLREVSNIFGSLQQVRSIFTLMPAQTDGDWA